MVFIQQLASTFASISNSAKAPLDIIDRVALSATPIDYRRIIDSIRDDVEVVMIGEASHGTQEFYHHRAEISKLLIKEKGFNAIFLEADWPDTHLVNEYVQNSRNNTSKNAIESLRGYQRFPLWMWRNNVMVQFIEWLRSFNDVALEKCGLFGMDVYSLENSRDAVLAFLDKYDTELPGLLEMAQDAYLGSTRRRANTQNAENVIRALEKYLNKYPHFEELFVALQNAKCVKGAAEYYNADNSWNYRDTFMVDTIKQVMNRSASVYERKPKAIIWAHNSHVGDSRYTHKQIRGEVTIGKLIREHWGLNKTANIGFTTYNGFVTAADEWGIPCRYKKVNDGMKGSIEEVFHKAVQRSRDRFTDGEFMLIFRSTESKNFLSDQSVIDDLGKHGYLERAIGVIYRPDTERWSHYFECKIAKQFDIIIHLDTTNALQPLDIPNEWVQNKKLSKST
jgi:erythromycin esterase-like protein